MAPRAPTILQIIPELDTGGAELSTIEIAEAVIAAGGRAIVLTEGGRMLDRLKATGADVRIFPAATKNPVKLWSNAATIAKIAKEESADIIHARSRAPAWSALLAARRSGCRFVTTYHGAYNEKSAAKRFYNGVMARGDLVIANSNYTRDLVRARYGTPDDRIRVIHRGVDCSVFAPDKVSEDRVERLRSEWGVRPDDRVILHAARLTNWKGQHVVVEAARRLHEQGRLDGIVILAGDAQGREAYAAGLRAAIAAGGLQDRVRLVGHVSDMPAAYRVAAASIVASVEPEAFGRTAVESQAMGCPVIATRIGAPPETVLSPPEHGPQSMTGWLVPPGDAGILADALSQALSLDPSTRQDLAARSRAHALSAFSLWQMRFRTLCVYDELLGPGLAARYVAAHPKNDG
ncbi:MAG: glycosyltransferase family 4 protein [Hyphomicrobium sp.]|nr:glycosyltransferase family 4 protein [Hyphomicrobium sp.]